MQQNVNFACVNCYRFAQIFALKPSIDLELKYIFGKPMKRRFQRCVVRTEMLSTFHTRVEYTSVQKYVILPIQTNGGTNAEKSPKQPLPFAAREPTSNT